MNAKLSRKMSLLGLTALIFYGVLLSAGVVSLEVMPQFVATAMIFIVSGRMMRRPAVCRRDEEEAQAPPRKKRSEQDWQWLSLLLNWGMSILLLSLMALWLMKPVGVDLGDAIKESVAHEQFFSGYVP